MGKRQDHRVALRALDRSQWMDYLRDHSGLPGPRANLELMQALVDEGDDALFDQLIASGEEYLVVCGVVGLGQLLAEGRNSGIEERLRQHARDPRWRVREAVAMGLQRLGDGDPPRLLAVVTSWAADESPLVVRAAVAAICEPRLLRGPEAVSVALDVCQSATETVVASRRHERRPDDVRVLRQALGYCWSVAVAADPAKGLPRYHALRQWDDPDVQWIVRENAKKARLARLLSA